MFDDIFTEIEDPNDIESKTHQLQKIQELQNKDPFEFIMICCINLNADSNPQKMLKITTYINATLKKKEMESIWLSDDVISDDLPNDINYQTKDAKKMRIKETLHQLIINSSSIIYQNVAESIFLIGSIEYRNNRWPSFFKDIFTLIDLDNISYNVAAAMIILERSITSKLLTPNYHEFDALMTELCICFQKLISSANQSTTPLTNTLISVIQMSFKLMKCSMPLIFKIVEQRDKCALLINIYLSANDIFRKEVYGSLAKLYKFYYNQATPEILEIFQFSMKDINGAYIDRKIYALKFWSKIAKIEKEIDDDSLRFILIKKEAPRKSNHFILGIYKFITPILFQIFQNIKLSEDSLDIDDQLEDVALECIANFAKVEPKVIIPEVVDFFRSHIKEKSSNFKYTALKVLSVVIRMCPYEIFLPFLINILECIESTEEKLINAALSFTAELISVFKFRLQEDEVTALITAVRSKLEYSETFNVLAQLVENQRITDISDIQRLIFSQTISLSFPAIISFIKNIKRIVDNKKTIHQILEALVLQFQQARNESDSDIVIKLCRSLRECFLQLEGEKLTINIQTLCNSIFDHFGKTYDEDLIDLICSLHSYIFEHDPFFVERLIPILESNLLSGNTQLICSSAELISDLYLSNPLEMMCYLDKFTQIISEILTSETTLNDIHGPLISFAADIINALGHNSPNTKKIFATILKNFVNVQIDPFNKNDQEYATELFEALLRGYTAITNFSDNDPELVIEVVKPIYTLLRRIHQMHLQNDLMLNFIVCIVNNLYCIKKERITFMTHHKAVKELLSDSIKAASTEEFKQKAQNLFTVLYSI